VHVERLWAEPGLRTEHVLRYTPPPPTRLVLSNPFYEPLRVVVDGREIGWLSPGMTQLSTLMNTRGKSVQSAPMHSGAERGDARRPPLVAAAYFTG
jgi:hypothetical protein